MDLVPGLFRILEIDGVDLEKCEIPFPIARGADESLDCITSPQRELPDLGGGNIDIVGAGEIIRIGRAQKPEAILQNFHNTFADDLGITSRQLLEDGKHQLLLPHGAGALNFQFLGKN